MRKSTYTNEYVIKLDSIEFYLNIPVHAKQRLEERIYAETDIEFDIRKRLEVIFANDEIADFVLNEIKIGESFAIFDFVYNVSMVLAIHTEDIDVKTIFYESFGKSLKLFEGQKIIEIHGDAVDFKQFIKRKKIKIN